MSNMKGMIFFMLVTVSDGCNLGLSNEDFGGGTTATCEIKIKVVWKHDINSVTPEHDEKMRQWLDYQVAACCRWDHRTTREWERKGKGKLQLLEAKWQHASW